MRRLSILLIGLATLASSCATLGREFPRCDHTFVDVPISIIMEIQAVSGAAFGPCLNELEPGWTYHHMQHETGRARFWLDSDRLGDRFVEVTLTETCDPGSATSRPHPIEGIARFVDATQELQPVLVVIIPIADAAVDYAAEVGLELAGVSVEGRPLALRLQDSADPVGSMAAAREAGAYIIAVNDTDRRQGTVMIETPTGARDSGVNLVAAVAAIEKRVDPGTYSATWYHLFDGGCVTFEFDAAGPGVEDVGDDVERAVGFIDLAELSRRAGEAGFILDESELDD